MFLFPISYNVTSIFPKANKGIFLTKDLCSQILKRRKRSIVCTENISVKEPIALCSDSIYAIILLGSPKELQNSSWEYPIKNVFSFYRNVIVNIPKRFKVQKVL